MRACFILVVLFIGGGHGLLAQQKSATQKPDDKKASGKTEPGKAKSSDDASKRRRGTGSRLPYPPKFEGAESETYKTVDQGELKLWYFKPAGHKPEEPKPAIIFFFGGGWRSGSPSQFEMQSRHFAKRGMIAVVADYRVSSRHQSNPTHSVSDARSAVRYLRRHAARIGLDPKKLAVAGGSAGGHLAACTALTDKFDDPNSDKNISAVGNALILFNPVMALAPPTPSDDIGINSQALANRLGAKPEELSPVHLLKKELPPTLMFFGDNDPLLKGAKLFDKQAKSLGLTCELKTFPGRQHGFFNFGRADNKDFQETLNQADQFLVTLGWLKPSDKPAP